MMIENKYKIQWKRLKKGGKLSQQEVIIYGEENVSYFMKSYPFGTNEVEVLLVV
jgi:hypothetical protein